MHKNSGIGKAERSFRNVLVSLADMFTITAKAEGEDPNPGGTSEPPASSINFESLIASARKEEKDKLYPRIKKLEEENKTLLQSNNANLLKVAALQTELDALKANPAENKEVEDLKIKLADMIALNEKLQKEAPNADAIRAEIEKEYEVKLYRTEKLAELKDSILPAFADLVVGKTKEELDSSLETAKTKTLETKKLLGLVDEEGKPINNTNTPPASGGRKPKTPPANPGSTNLEDKLFDEEYIRNLDPKSPEYKEWRVKMGLDKH